MSEEHRRPIVRMATLVFLSFALSFGALPFALSAAECDSAVQITEKNSQVVIENISREPLVAYLLTSHSRSQGWLSDPHLLRDIQRGGLVSAGAVHGTWQSRRDRERTIHRLRPIGE